MPKILLLLFMSILLMSFAQDSTINRKFSGKISGGFGGATRDIGSGVQLNIGYSWLKKSKNPASKVKIGHNFYLNISGYDRSYESNIVPDNSKGVSIFNLCFDWSLRFQKVNRRTLYTWFFQPSIGFLVGYHTNVIDGPPIYPLPAPAPAIYYPKSGNHLGVTITPISFEFPIGHQHWLIQFPIQFNAINFLNNGTPMPPLFGVNFGFRFN